MSLIKKIRDFAIIVAVSIILYSILCAAFYFLIHYNSLNTDTKYNSNTIRSTYPNYSQENHDFSLNIFEDYAAPKTSYRSFVGFRRQEFIGNTVKIDSQGFRKSNNHSVEGSVWFFGGSTMWGTGADDGRTIPSLFAKMTGEKVLNLGESGYNSLQELVQLQIMLSAGHKPKEVIFYDGVNDGYLFCQNDSEDQIRHSYTSRYKTLQDDYKKAKKKLKARPVFDFERMLSSVYEFYKIPLTYFRTSINGNRNNSKQLSDIPIKSMAITKKYLHCNDDDFARKAANITIQSWRSAAAILEKLDIPIWFVLQPTATYKPEKYKLDYIINLKKQAIVNEKNSYSSYYKTLKKQFQESCMKFNDCSSFIDLSELFFDVDDYIFIDTCHVSPNGNEIISNSLVNRIRSNSTKIKR